MPYCRRCGTKLEENARFCHKCGTPVATFNPLSIPPPPPARPLRKDPLVVTTIILVATLLAAVIISAIIFAPLYPVSFNQTNQDNQPNINKLTLNFQADNAQVNVVAQNITDKNVLIAVSATGSRGIFGSTNPFEVTYTNKTLDNELIVTSKVTETANFLSGIKTTCNIYVNPLLTLNLNISSKTGQISLSTHEPATLQSLNLETTTGVVQVNIQNNVTIAGNLSLKTQTGGVWFRMSQANVQGNTTVDLQSTMGSVNMDIAENKTLQGNIQVNASTRTGNIDVGLIIDGDVGAKITAQTNLGTVHLINAQNFSGNQSPIQSNNYPATSNIQINNKATIGNININASYQSSITPSIKN